MTTKKISELSAAAALDGTEQVPVVQAGATLRSTVSAFLVGVVKLVGNQTIAGTKTFSDPPVVPTATLGTHAISKAQAEGLVTSGATVSGTRPPVKVVSLTNQNVGLLSLPGPIDGYQPVDGDRVLLVGQTAPAENGIWTVGALLGWQRPADFATASNQAGAGVNVAGGTVYKGSAWVLNSTGTVTVGGSAQTWIQDATAVRTAALALKADDSAVVHDFGNENVGGIKTFLDSPVVPDGSWPVAATFGLQAALDAKAADSAVVKLTGDQTIAGNKTFASSPIIPTPTSSLHAVTKSYVDGLLPSFYVGAPAAGSASGKDKVAVSAAITAALASGSTAALVNFAGGNYDVGDLAVVLPKFGSGPQLTFRGPVMTTLTFSVDRGAGTFAVKGDSLESDLYFHTFDGVGIAGPGARGTVGQPPVNIIGGGPTLMSGVWVGSRMKFRNGGVSGFRAGMQIMGNHIEMRSWNCPNNLDGIYWAQAYGNSGDVVFDNCALDGNLRASHCIANYSIATFKMHKGQLGFSPYAFYCEPGRTGVSAIAMGGVILDGTSVEFCGNGFIYDPDQFARIVGFHCIQVGTWSISPVTYRIPGSAADSWIKVFEFSGVTFEGGMPQDGSVSGTPLDGPLFDFTGTVRMKADSWKSEYASVLAAGQTWMLSTLPPKVILTDTKDDSEARALKAAQTVTAGQLLEHNGQSTYAVRPYGHFGAGVRGPYAGVAFNGATGGTRTCVICVTRGDRIPVLIDTVTAGSYAVVADGTVAGKAVGIVYDGTNTSTTGRPLIGLAYFGPLVASTTSDVQLTGAM